MQSKDMSATRFEKIGKKYFYYLEEIKALKDGGVFYFIGFGILIVLLFPVLILELVILLISGKDLGWFQTSEYVDKRIVLKPNEAHGAQPERVLDDNKSASRKAPNRDQFLGSKTLRELDKPDQKESLIIQGDIFLEKYQGQSVDELIGLQNTHRIDSIVLAFESALDVRRDNGEELTGVEWVILVIEGLEREVNNGGFSQFFYNSTVEYAPLMVASLNNIGCYQVANIAQRAIDILAVDSLDPDTIEKRMDPDDEVLEQALGELDELYFKNHEVLSNALFEYIKNNRISIKLE
jgi:hypothetical protein